MLIDKSTNQTDNSHHYVQLPQKTKCRYIKIKNIEVPDGHFALSGLRVFGNGNGELPAQVTELKVNRHQHDKRGVTLNWNRIQNATGYNISYGLDENSLYHHHMVYNDTTVTINSLNANYNYYFTIEVFNENGTTPGKEVIATR